jgi:hypothetical protein
LKHPSEILTKTPEKTFENIVNIRKILIKHLHHICENICNIQINTLATYIGKKIDKTLRTRAYNIGINHWGKLAPASWTLKVTMLCC